MTLDGMTPTTLMTTAPKPVRLAVGLLCALIGVAVVRTVYVIVAHRLLVDAYLDSKELGYLPRDVAEQFAPAYTVITLIGALGFAVVIGLAMLYMLRGRRWARILATVFCALTVLGGVVTLVQPATAVYRLLGVLSALIALAALITMFQSAANRYFAARQHVATA
jgi:hypothetical protein